MVSFLLRARLDSTRNYPRYSGDHMRFDLVVNKSRESASDAAKNDAFNSGSGDSKWMDDPDSFILATPSEVGLPKTESLFKIDRKISLLSAAQENVKLGGRRYIPEKSKHCFPSTVLFRPISHNTAELGGGFGKAPEDLEPGHKVCHDDQKCIKPRPTRYS